MQQQFNKVGKVETGSVALPAIMRSGAGGPESFHMGSMPQAKQHITSGQMHRGHMPPLVHYKQFLNLYLTEWDSVNCELYFLPLVYKSLMKRDAFQYNGSSTQPAQTY